MKNSYFTSIIQVAKSMLLLLALYSLCRLLFYLFNLASFSDIPLSELLLIFIAGLRFDISAVLMVNGLFLLLALFPFINKENSAYQSFLKYFFITTNSIAILFNCIDFAYFKFTLKRTTAELFSIREDVGNLLGQYILDYWYIAVLWFLLCYLLYRFYPAKRTNEKPKLTLIKVGIDVLILLLVAGLSLLGIRGGFQLKPLRIITAAEYTSAQNIPLVLNTPFTLIKSLNANYIAEYNFYPEKDLEKLSPFIHPAATGEMKKENVVVIILESFSKEYLGYFNKGKGYTPFLDSLMEHSLVFENSYANGKKSIEGIPAVLASIPSLMENPYITSVYGANQLAGLGTLLKKKGYATSFYHGGSNGTMGFDAFAKIAGFDTYYGRNEYNNEQDFDGHWGIYDEPFLSYFANLVSKNKEPFCAAFFTLSSHHPYSIPTAYKNKFPKGTLEIHESIGYTDFALQQFFKTAAQLPWFKNTLFVITADHTSLSESPYYQGKVGSYAIPIVFYKANNSLTAKSSIAAQQIDILPTILAELNYNEAYFSFGKNLLNKEENHFAITYLNGIYQSISAEYSLQFDGEKSIAFYNIKKDSLMNNNLLSQQLKEQKLQEQEVKKFIQHFNSCLIQNKMTVK